MTDTFRDLEEQARSLSVEERARLAQVLLDSLREKPLADVEAAWEREIEQRVAAYESGKLQTVTAEDVFAEARRLIR